MSHIAFIGTGVMGAPMAGHLARAGHEVHAVNRTYAKAQKAAETYGYKAELSLAEALKGADVVFTMAGFPSEVEELYFAPGGILALAKPGALLIDLTTSTPALAEKIAKEGLKRSLLVVDAPVSGGDSGAKAGTLVVMCGGSEEAFDAAKPYLECFGKSVTRLGEAGFGQHCKACNQICVAGNTAAYSEAMVYANKVGLDPSRMFQVISGGAAGSWQIEHMAPRALAGDIAPGFFIKHFIKDMRIALSEAEAKGLKLPMTTTVLQLYEDLAAAGKGDLGTQALFEEYKS